MNKNTKRGDTGSKHKINDQIRDREVRLVGDNVESVIVTIEEARAKAESLELDLVVINDQARPAICRIMDYGKFIFDTNKKPKQPKVKPMKEMRYTPNIGESDFEFKLKHVRNFLEGGHKVKAFVFFRGREMTFKVKGEQILLRLSVEIEDIGVPEGMPKFEGKKCIIIFKPKK